MTGARLGELTGAKVRDFDPDAGTLQVNGKTGPREIQLASATILLLRRAASGRSPEERLWRRLTAPPGRRTSTRSGSRRRCAEPGSTLKRASTR